ncbi:unnamed protein product [Discosporangium mesarthrocarpum]
MRTTAVFAFAAILSCADGFVISPRMSGDVLEPFRTGKALKVVISGLNKFDADLVAKVAKATAAGGGTHIDIACDPELVRVAKSISSVPVCVSAVDPKLFPACVEAGAEMVELGNFDSFYEQGLTFTAKDVLEMTRQTRELLPQTPLSVTVPHTLHLDEQVNLAQDLETLGVDVIQTEGKFSLDPSKGGIQGAIERAAPTLAAAHAISRAVQIPVMAASGLSDVTAPMALAAGAKGVGVGSAVNKLNSEVMMVAVVRSIATSMGLPSPASSSAELAVEQEVTSRGA